MKINEDAPTNSTGPAISGTSGNPDEVVVRKKTRNKYKENNSKGSRKSFSDFLAIVKRRGI